MIAGNSGNLEDMKILCKASADCATYVVAMRHSIPILATARAHATDLVP